MDLYLGPWSYQLEPLGGREGGCNCHHNTARPDSADLCPAILLDLAGQWLQLSDVTPAGISTWPAIQDYFIISFDKLKRGWTLNNISTQ